MEITGSYYTPDEGFALPTGNQLLYIDSEGMKELIGNLIEYALARDSFRSIKK